MAVRKDTIQISVEIEAQEGVKTFQGLSDRARKATDEMRKLKRAGKENTDEFKKLEKELAEVNGEFAKLGGAGATMGQLIGRSKQLNREIKSLAPGTERFIAATKELKAVNSRLAEIRKETKGVASNLESMKQKGSALGGIFAKAFAAFAVMDIARSALSFTKELFSLSTELEIFGKKNQTVFGEAIDIVQDYANSNAHALGLTRGQYLDTAAAAGDLLVPMGFQREEAAQLSVDLVNLSGALSEWSGGQRSSAEVSEILTKALLGERESLKSLGVSITEADVKARLAAKGQAELTGKALEQAKAMATLELITEKSTDAQAQFLQNSDSLARKQVENTARFNEFKEVLANALIPAFHGLLDALDPVFDVFSQVIAVISSGQKPTGQYANIVKLLSTGFQRAGDFLGVFYRTFGAVINLISGNGRKAILNAELAFKNLGNSIIRIVNLIPGLKDIELLDTSSALDELAQINAAADEALGKSTEFKNNFVTNSSSTGTTAGKSLAKSFKKEIKERIPKAIEETFEEIEFDDESVIFNDKLFATEQTKLKNFFLQGLMSQEEYEEEKRTLELRAFDRRLADLSAKYGEDSEQFLSIQNEKLEAIRMFEDQQNQIAEQSADKRKEIAQQEAEERKQITATLVNSSKELVSEFSNFRIGLIDAEIQELRDKEKEEGKLNASQERRLRQLNQKRKNTQITSTVVSGLVEVQKIWEGAAQLGPIAGPIIGALQTGAAVLRTGKAVNAIRSKNFYSGGHTGTKGLFNDTQGRKIVGGVHENEWVAPSWQVQHPVYGQMIEFLETARTRNFMEGGFSTTPSPSLLGAATGGVIDNAEQRRLIERQIEEMRLTRLAIQKQKLIITSGQINEVLQEDNALDVKSGF